MTPENPEEPNAPQPETLDFLFDQIIEADDRQLAAQQSLDQKVIQVFTGSGIVLGFAAFLATSDVPGGAIGFLIAAGALFLVLGLVTFWHLWPRRFYITRHGADLWAQYWSDSVPVIKHAMVDYAVYAYEQNARALRRQVFRLQAVLALAGLEVTCVAVAIIWTAAA